MGGGGIEIGGGSDAEVAMRSRLHVEEDNLLVSISRT